jgi:aerobic C4-dicarboxylate transport protein
MKKSPPFYLDLFFQVLVAMAAGAAFGYLAPAAGASLKVLADAFVALIKMMVAPVVFCTIVTGIAGIAQTGKVGKTVVKSIVLFYVLTALALIVGLVVVFAFRPGAGMNIDPAHLDASSIAAIRKQAAPLSPVDFLLHIIPQSFLGAFTGGEVLPVLLVSVIVGGALRRIGSSGEPLLRVIDSFAQMLFAAFATIVKLSPVAAFGAMSFTVGKYGFHVLRSLALLVGTYYAGGILFVAGVIAPLAWFNGLNLWQLIRYFREELAIIFATSTSEPLLPRLLLKLEALGCQKGIVGLVLPLSYSFNLDGIAIFLSVASLFIAQACNIDLSFDRMITLLVLMLFTSNGAAGVAGSGFVVLAATLSTSHDIPVAGLSLIIGVDRFMSGMRAVTSTVSNTAVSIIIAKWENALDRRALRSELYQTTVSLRQGCVTQKQ